MVALWYLDPSFNDDGDDELEEELAPYLEAHDEDYLDEDDYAEYGDNVYHDVYDDPETEFDFWDDDDDEYYEEYDD